MKPGKQNITLENTEQMLCVAGPPDFQSQPLSRVPLERLTGQCSPRILPLYAPNHQVLLGDQIQLDCRAVGQPQPQISWLLPPRESGYGEQGLRMVKSSSHLGSDDRVIVSESGTLYITDIENGDQGQWTCTSQSHSRFFSRVECYVFLHTFSERIWVSYELLCNFYRMYYHLRSSVKCRTMTFSRVKQNSPQSL